jgi:hypothetical protein
MRVLAYAAGMPMEEFAKEVAALHTAFLEQAAADGLIAKGQVAAGREVPAPNRLRRRLPDSRNVGARVVPGLGLGTQYRVMPNLGSVGEQMMKFARMRTMMLMQWMNMMRGPVGLPGNGK